MTLDDKDRAIGFFLKETGKATIKEISKATGMRPSTIHGRIKRMEENGNIVNYTVKLNDEEFDRGFAVYMLIAGTMEPYLDEKMLKHPAITVVSGLTGEYDLLIKMKFSDLAAFNDFLLDFREKYKDHIHKTVTMVETVSLKEEL